MLGEGNDDQVFYSSVVLEHIVPTNQEAGFERWYLALIRLAERQAGFLRADTCPPLVCLDGVVKRYSIIHFDTPNHLNDCITSNQWEAMLESGRHLVQNYKFKSFTTGLEGWFSSRAGAASLGPPRWKQVLAVVLGLYPIVMLQGQLFGALGIMQTWPPASAMLVSNLITSIILTWVIMPQISQLLRFWLRPAYAVSSVQVNLLGALMVLLAYIVMVILFSFVY